MMRLSDETEILNEDTRKAIIEEIEGSENRRRKDEHRKRWEVYKDRIAKYVELGLAGEGLLPETVQAMMNRAANVNICKKIVNKLARAYSGGTNREAFADDAEEPNEESTKTVEKQARYLNLDQKMKKADRYRELHHNCLLAILPKKMDSQRSEEDVTSERDLFEPTVSALSPWQYDVIEDMDVRERAMVVILSEFTGASAKDKGSDNKDNKIADNPGDSGKGSKKEYIWWTDTYHFTTDENGKILPDKSNEDGLNPIKRLPFVNNAEDQDGQFWALGGDDIIDGTILVNKVITDMFYIAYVQGFGQMVITGQSVGKKQMSIGPNQALILEYGEEEERPEVNILSAAPPLDSWMNAIELYVALLLTTKNLSPSNVSARLQPGNFPSAVALLVEQSEATDDVTEKQKDYTAIEMDLFDIVNKWAELYRGFSQLTDRWTRLSSLPDGTKVVTQFNEIRQAVSEGEKLTNLQKRQTLGLNTLVELIQIDNPSLTDEEARERALKLAEEKVQAIDAALTDAMGGSPQETPTATPTPVEGEVPVEAAEGGLELQQELALNGAQVTAILELLQKVAEGSVPKAAAKAILEAAFNIKPERAGEIVDPIVEGSVSSEGAT